MGFKKENYEVKSMGITLPEVYAVIRRIEVTPISAVAVFGIHTSRERALDKELNPIETVKVEFTDDRKTSAYELAYAKAKEVKTVEWTDGDGEARTTEVKGAFTDWEDDIV